MADHKLFAYYEDELEFIREMGREFARDHSPAADRLHLKVGAGKSEDPHVERLLQGFAFLAARVRQKLDDEFPEITNALLGALYPHLTRPLPSMAIAQFLPGPDPQGLVGGFPIESGSRLHWPKGSGSPCRFRTAYPVTLWPVEVEEAQLQSDRVVFPDQRAEAVALLQLRLRCRPGVSVADLGFDRVPPLAGRAATTPRDFLRFYLDGDSRVVRTLYDSLFTNTCQVLLQGQGASGTEVIELPIESIRSVGFGPDEGLFPYPDRSFPGYRLLQEYFAFHEKFLFFDVTGLKALAGRDWGDVFDLLIFFNAPPRGQPTVRPDHFRLGCTPVVNLFPIVAEPIVVNQTQVEYRVVPDVHRPKGAEVYSIDTVTCTSASRREAVRLESFYALRHATAVEEGLPFWYASRRPSPRKDDEGTEVYLTFVDPDFNPRRPTDETLTVHATCTNRDLPASLLHDPQFDSGRAATTEADFELESHSPVSRVRCLRTPTASYRPASGKSAQWALISQLSLNHLSLADSREGLAALRAILKLHDLARTPATIGQIAGLIGLKGRPVTGRVGRSVCQGIEVSLEFDESHYVGSGVLLLASVLERFLGMYVSINSFSQLVATTRQRGELKRWRPRSGDRTLL